jgi:ribosomal protein S27AE
MTARTPPYASAEKSALISPCGQYRYSLLRRWNGQARTPLLAFVMLNPSTADAYLDDPTIRRCMRFGHREGYGGIVVYNLYGWRSADPKSLLTCTDPVGPWSDQILQGAAEQAADDGTPIVAAWGANARPGRVTDVLALLRGSDLRCLGTTAQGHPRHPLYVKGDQPLVPFATAQSAPTPESSVVTARPSCPRCGEPVTVYLTRLRCYPCGWSSEDEGTKRDIRGRERRG